MKKNKPAPAPDEITALRNQLAQIQQESATFRQQRDNITQQLQDLDAKSGIAINALKQQLEAVQKRIAELAPPTPGAFGGKSK